MDSNKDLIDVSEHIDQLKMVKNVMDKKFSKSNIQLADMLKNKAFQAITDFKNGFRYVTTQKVPETSEES